MRIYHQIKQKFSNSTAKLEFPTDTHTWYTTFEKDTKQYESREDAEWMMRYHILIKKVSEKLKVFTYVEVEGQTKCLS